MQRGRRPLLVSLSVCITFDSGLAGLWIETTFQQLTSRNDQRSKSRRNGDCGSLGATHIRGEIAYTSLIRHLVVLRSRCRRCCFTNRCPSARHGRTKIFRAIRLPDSKQCTIPRITLHDVVSLAPGLLQMWECWTLRWLVALSIEGFDMHTEFFPEVCSSSERLCYNCACINPTYRR